MRYWRGGWEGELSLSATVKVRDAKFKAMKYLEKSQDPRGAGSLCGLGIRRRWMMRIRRMGRRKFLLASGGGGKKRGMDWLVAAQNRDGGWGGAAEMESSIEETALAVNALAANSRRCQRRLSGGRSG
jgi:hypothetical protein